MSTYWKLKKSRVAGYIPTLNEIDRDTIVLNQVDGIAYVRKMAADPEDPDIVIPIAGGNVQSDWLVEDQDDPAYIWNKPIPLIGPTGATGATGAASTVPGPTGATGAIINI